MNKTVRNCLIAAAASAVLLALLLIFGSGGSLSNASETGGYPVYINEIMTDFASSNVPADYIELYNSADYSVRIGGFRLTDGKSGHLYSIPADTVLSAHGYFVVYCSAGAESSAFAPFGLSSLGGETVSLLTKKSVVLSTCVTAAVPAGCSFSRGEDGVWYASEVPTPGAPNSTLTSEEIRAADPIRFSELVVENALYPLSDGSCSDFIELHNRGSEPVSLSGYSLSDRADLSRYVFPADAIIEAGGFFTVSCSPGIPGCADFSLSSSGGETVYLRNPEGFLIDSVVTFSAASGAALWLDNDGAAAVSDFATPGFENSEAGREEYLSLLGVSDAAVVITELMAVNKTALASAAGEFPDWLELTNPGTEPVSLKGWFLSDDLVEPAAWSFPDVVLDSGERILVFCGGTSSEGELHCSFRLSGSGETVTLTAPGGVAVDRVSYSYAEEDVSLVRDPVSGELSSCSDPTPGFPDTSAGRDAFCRSLQPAGSLAIWELMSLNKDYLYRNGASCDWVELKNVSDRTVDLSNWSLTDNTAKPLRFQLPDAELAPGEYVIVFLSGDGSISDYDADFSLDAFCDSLYLYENGVLSDYVLAEGIPAGMSLGREDSGSGFLYMDPTPGEENLPGLRRVSDSPVFSEEPGLYTPGETLTVAISAPGTVYYTLDGSAPDTDSAVYLEPITVTGDTVLRACSAEEGKLISPSVSASYLFSESTIPVLSLSADPDTLFGRNGIYKSNWSIKEIEIPANLSYYGSDGTFSNDCGISLHGMTSILVSEKKSFTVRFRNEYGGHLNFDLFGDGSTDYASILLRADVEGVVSTMMRDNLMGEIAAEYSDSLMGMKYRYAHLWLNGEYWGIYCIRQHYSTEYYAAQLGCREDTCTMLKSFSLKGDALYEVREYMESHNMRSDEVYDCVCSHVDVESFADWMIFEAYTGNIDVNGNMRYFYSDTDGLWRCALCDVDLGFFGDDCFFSPLNALQHGVMMRSLMQNRSFQRLLGERLAFWLRGELSNEAVAARLEGMKAELLPEIDKDAARWGYRVYAWEREVTKLEQCCAGRSIKMIRDYRTRVSIPGEELNELFGGIS